MSGQSTQLHNIVAVGEMSGMLAAAFPSFAHDTAVLSTRLAHVPDAAGPWPAALFHENVAFNWLFLNAGDLPAAGCLLRRAQHIAPCLVHCHVPEADMDTLRVAALLEAESSKDGFGIILSCHTAANFHAPGMLRAFLRGGATGRRAGAGAHDPCYAPARELILSTGTVSLVQRTFRIGYARAARLIDAMAGDILVRDAVTGALCLRPA